MDLWSLQQKLYPPGGCSAAGSTRRDHPIRLLPASPLATSMTRVVTAAKSSEAAAAQRRGAARLGAGAGAGTHARATRSLREAALELETVEPATARKTDATDSSYAVQIRGIISASFGGRRAEDTFTFASFRDHYGDSRSTIYETDVFRLPDFATGFFLCPRPMNHSVRRKVRPSLTV